MQTGDFYFIQEQYFIDFPDSYLMQNKGPAHDRPCFFAFADAKTGLYWLIPFSSQVEKFQKIYQNKVKRYGACDTIIFGEVLGWPKAFLIQNMCPISSEYIKQKYLDKHTNLPVRINGVLAAKLVKKARKVLALQRRGYKLIYPDVLTIEAILLQKLINN